jgi:hypothetical protein
MFSHQPDTIAISSASGLKILVKFSGISGYDTIGKDMIQ